MATNVSSVIVDGKRVDFYYTEAGTLMVVADGTKRRANANLRASVEAALAEAEAKAKAAKAKREAEAKEYAEAAKAKAEANAKAKAEAAKRKAEAEAKAEAKTEAEAEAAKAEAEAHAKLVKHFAEAYRLYGTWDALRGATMTRKEASEQGKGRAARGIEETIMQSVEAAWDALEIESTICEATKQRIEYTRGKYVVQLATARNGYKVIGSIPCPMVRGSINLVELYASTMGKIDANDLDYKRIPWAYKQTQDMRRSAINWEAKDGTKYRFATNKDGNASAQYLSWSAFSKRFVESYLLSAAIHAACAASHKGIADVRISYVPTERGRIGYAMTPDERKQRETEATRAKREKAEAAKRLREARAKRDALYARKEAAKLQREAIEIERELAKLNAQS